MRRPGDRLACVPVTCGRLYDIPSHRELATELVMEAGEHLAYLLSYLWIGLGQVGHDLVPPGQDASQRLKLRVGERWIRFQKIGEPVKERRHSLRGHPIIVGIEINIDLPQLSQESGFFDFELGLLKLHLGSLTLGFGDRNRRL